MDRKGQFSIIAALLVAVILIATVITTYSIVRDSQVQDQPQLMSAIDETNLAIRSVLGYTVGYYGSVLQVTGDSSYANTLAIDYLQDGLENITTVHPDWGTSLNLTQKNIHTYWYANSSYCTGNLTVNYDLVGLGISGVEYNAACRLQVDVENATSSSEIRLTVLKDEGEPLINLGTQNFKFYNYTYFNSTWTFVNPPSIQASFPNGTYVIDAPSSVNPKFCVVQVEDPRGLIVTASSYSRYVCTFDWNSSLYSTLANGAVALELLQNGTMRWLGQSLTSQAMPIPPVPVKSIHVNETINNIDQEVPFQVEDWESDYRVPLGLANNASLFGSNNMIVFLVNENTNYNLSKVTVWWDGSDTAVQTPYAIYNSATSPFKNSSLGKLSNSVLNLTLLGMPILTVNSTIAGCSVNGTAAFFRINGKSTGNGANESYPILNGIVRDIVHQEGEWSNGISEYLWVDVNTSDYRNWTTAGSSPYLNDNDNNYIYDNTNNHIEGWFSFQNISTKIDNANVKIQFECYCQNGGDEYFQFAIDNGTTTSGYFNITSLASGWNQAQTWKEYDVSDLLRTSQAIDNARVRIRYRLNSGAADRIYIRRCRLYVTTCPNVYSQIIVTLPANTTYYTYQLRLMFMNSAQNRTITDLCPVKLSAISSSATSALTENGTDLNGYPIVSVTSLTDLFYNLSSSSFARHHWSQLNSSTPSGIGIMFTDSANEKLYYLDSIAKGKTGALRINATSRSVELMPVSSLPASFTDSLDITWQGAIVTYTGSATPVYGVSGGKTTGLWILAEYPPSVTITAQS
jgi:uncharacterized protein (UPF0333 family)